MPYSVLLLLSSLERERAQGCLRWLGPFAPVHLRAAQVTLSDWAMDFQQTGYKVSTGNQSSRQGQVNRVLSFFLKYAVKHESISRSSFACSNARSGCDLTSKCSSEHYAMPSKTPEFDLNYVAYLKDDPAQEPIAVSYSSPGVLAEAAHKTGSRIALRNHCDC